MSKSTLFLKQFSAPHLKRYKSTVVKQTPAEYCLNLVRKYDYENFLCTLLLPNAVRSTAFAIRAFNIEVAQVEEQVRDNTIGMMRLKFWEETLDKVFNNAPPKSPAALELHRAINRHKLSKRYLKRLIVSRSEKLSSSIFPNLETLETYSENSVSPIYYLMLEASGLKNIHADHAASHLGKAHGIATLIRSVPHNAQRRSIVLPQDVLLKHNVSTETVLRGQSAKGINDAVFEVSSRAKQHLDKARALRDNVPKEANTIFLPATTVDIYLENLRQADFDVFHPSLQKRNTLLPFKLYWKKLLSQPY